ncbi:MAG: hypothetical protein WCA32_23995 [Chromatiaceae bacterium]
MAHYTVRETFFRPEEHSRQHSSLPADIINAMRTLLTRSGGNCLFVPIRSMQYQAVVERDEIVFVDAQGGYAHQDGEGGRLIRIAWQPAPVSERESLTAPVTCDVVYYFADLREVQRRLLTEIRPALEQIIRRQLERTACAVEPRVVPFRRAT